MAGFLRGPQVIGFVVIDFLRNLQRRSFVRGALTSSLATASDFVAAHLLHTVHVPAAAATVLGCMVGGCVAFSLNRNWAFHARNERKRTQLVRFLFVWATSALLNAAGVSLVPATGRSLHASLAGHARGGLPRLELPAAALVRIPPATAPRPHRRLTATARARRSPEPRW
jgi:putative flippase GtrA